MARKNTTGIDPKRVREVMKLRGVSRWTAHRWLKAQERPPRPPVMLYYTLSPEARTKDVERHDRYLTLRTLTTTLRIARSCVRRAEKLALAEGFEVMDMDMLNDIADRAARMCVEWHNWRMETDNAGKRMT
jgi:predicted DNA-binding transcriptional regulator AlpA